jgi:hypothetical protein
MPRGKIDLQVLASLNTPCPKCGHLITPPEIKRITWDGSNAQLAASNSILLSQDKREKNRKVDWQKPGALRF